MKTTSNQVLSAILISSTLILTLASPAMAVDSTLNDNSTEKDTVACTRMSTLKSNSESTVETHLSTLEKNFKDRTTKIASKESDVDQKVAAARLAAKNQFDDKIQTILARTDLTQAQILAVNTFKTAMQQAEVTRAAAVDAARAAYRTALADTVSTHQQALSDAANEYQTAVKEAFDAATTECGKGTAATTLRSSIKTARDKLTATREDTKITTTVKQLATTRNTAIQAANKAFSDSAAALAATLTAALESTSSTQQ